LGITQRRVSRLVTSRIDTGASSEEPDVRYGKAAIWRMARKPLSGRQANPRRGRATGTSAARWMPQEK
jgi:hypothetical protein